MQAVFPRGFSLNFAHAELGEICEEHWKVERDCTGTLLNFGATLGKLRGDSGRTLGGDFGKTVGDATAARGGVSCGEALEALGPG